MFTLMNFEQFITDTIGLMLQGSRLYYAWVGFLLVLILVGGLAYANQLNHGLLVTNMRDQVSWGFYIGNFTFLVGVAAASIMLVIPAYIYDWAPIKEITILGEMLAVTALIMCLGFVMVDIGRPDRFWHIMPLVGRLNWPQSMLAWDVIVLNLYLLLNWFVVTYLLFSSYAEKHYNKKIVLPLVLASIPMAISIHTVTAYLYNGLASRPFWNSAILAPRFLASAFCSGPAVLLILLQVLRRTTRLKITDEAIFKIAELMAYTMGFNLFLTAAESFKELYSGTEHTVYFQYLLFGLEKSGVHYNTLVPFAWASIITGFVAFLLFLISKTRMNWTALNIGCVLIYASVYIEKGMGLIIPGLTPDALGEIYVYRPSFTEIAVAVGIFSLGALIFTIMLKAAVPMMLGEFTITRGRKPAKTPEAELIEA
ncbi:sulfate reduction electron transfer complex DsrMKJOP subunit DsrP [Geothrix sp. PMB-07]|uniref:sulfate reduction electron transfer complex DsrMKJOP subunit DsrP n=1 Tax=Geothrix sp. PMB-07 TaxID=3068640 RepID=UPI0027413E82|nr:NrfD/PsrC family molybdoenzyme membrane anchor subunit [Geothrix sp. PMB-07]WLT30307.1 NrfD/PsrC family molybdoenzyme membrane anchor subunit [Geothrix sp. PMB-07]